MQMLLGNQIQEYIWGNEEYQKAVREDSKRRRHTDAVVNRMLLAEPQFEGVTGCLDASDDSADR